MEDLTFPFSSKVTENPGFSDLILFVLFLKQLKLLKMVIKNVWAHIKSFGLIYSPFSAHPGHQHARSRGYFATVLERGKSL